MIRLSEAMARLSCKDEVQPKHVNEAFRLLNKSVIRVETPDINFDDEEPQQNIENGMRILAYGNLSGFVEDQGDLMSKYRLTSHPQYFDYVQCSRVA